MALRYNRVAYTLKAGVRHYYIVRFSGKMPFIRGTTTHFGVATRMTVSEMRTFKKQNVYRDDVVFLDLDEFAILSTMET